jgi:hypothetical protein
MSVRARVVSLVGFVLFMDVVLLSTNEALSGVLLGDAVVVAGLLSWLVLRRMGQK